MASGFASRHGEQLDGVILLGAYAMDELAEDLTTVLIYGSEDCVLNMENYEKSLLESVLRNSTSLRDAGSKLGVNASTISRKIKQYGIDYPGKK